MRRRRTGEGGGPLRERGRLKKKGETPAPREERK